MAGICVLVLGVAGAENQAISVQQQNHRDLSKLLTSEESKDQKSNVDTFSIKKYYSIADIQVYLEILVM